jgi:hypothetical protein
MEHGDIVELYTEDPKARPLQSWNFWSLYTPSRIISALKGAGFLQLVFRGNPPDIDPVPSAAKDSTFWEAMIQTALDVSDFPEKTRPGGERLFMRKKRGHRQQSWCFRTRLTEQERMTECQIKICLGMTKGATRRPTRMVKEK